MGRILAFFVFGVFGGPLLLVLGFYLYANPAALGTVLFIIASLVVIPALLFVCSTVTTLRRANKAARAAYDAGVDRSVGLALQGRGRNARGLVAGAPTERG